MGRACQTVFAVESRRAAVTESATHGSADTGGIGVVHLVWAPLGPMPLREFLRSYRAYSPGVDHELVIVLAGVASEKAEEVRPTRLPRSRLRLRRHRHVGGREHSANADTALTQADLRTELAGIDHRLIVLDRPVFDLAAYGLAARKLQHGRLCFMNSYSAVLCDDWLALLTNALAQPDIGLVGATASWESQAEWIRGPAYYWPYQLARLRAMRRDYPRFPNPHIRTTSFAVERHIVLTMGLERAADKSATYLLESGHRSITRQVLERGLRVLVAGRDRELYPVERWADSRTYRSGSQENLIVADRRTRDWELASARMQRRLSRDAWGDRRAGAPTI